MENKDTQPNQDQAAEPLVLVPGMMCDARLFAPQIAAFSGARDLFLATIAAHDQVPALAEAILTRAPERFALAGLSMGGIVAMEILRQAPDRVSRIALLATNPQAESDKVKAFRAPLMQAVRDGHLAQVMTETKIPSYMAPGADRPDVRELCLEMALGLGGDVFLRQSRALMDRPDQQETLRAADIPALVLCGRHDALCPVSRHELMAELLPAAELKIIEDAGHLPTLEFPDITNDALRRWLEA